VGPVSGKTVKLTTFLSRCVIEPRLIRSLFVVSFKDIAFYSLLPSFPIFISDIGISGKLIVYSLILSFVVFLYLFILCFLLWSNLRKGLIDLDKLLAMTPKERTKVISQDVSLL